MWYYNLNNQPAGPVDETVMKTLFARGVVNFDTLVWQEGMPAWVRLGETQIVQQALAAEQGTAVARRKVYIPGRPESGGLNKLFVWWLVTNCFMVLFMVFNLGSNILASSMDPSWSALLVTLTCIFEIPVIASQILQYVLLYKLWKVIEDGYESTSAGKAVGFLFIPFYNLYWYFRAYWGLGKDLNRYIDRHFPNQDGAGPRKAKEWLSLTYLVFMFAGAVLIYIFAFVYMFSMVEKGLYDPTAASSFSNYLFMLPFVIGALVYSMGQWGLMTAMFIDFHRSAASILTTEDQPLPSQRENM